MTKIFIVGGTGHIGGAVLDAICTTYPEVELTALVRDEQKANRLVSKYPYVIPVIGGLNSLELLKSASESADIVINAGPDITHDAGIAAIIKGLENRSEKGYYIHTSGGALIWDEPDGSKPGTKIWDDVADIDEITSMPEYRTHRQTDKLVFAASPNVNVAIVSPTILYGLGPSIEHPVPLTIPEILNTVGRISGGFMVSAGKNLQSYVHVVDLARLYLLLVSYAIDGKESVAGMDLWGPKAYYFGADEEVGFADFMAALVSVLRKKGMVSNEEITPINVADAAKAHAGANAEHAPSLDSWSMHIAMMYGTDMRVCSTRGKNIGWQPQEPAVRETLEEVVERYLAEKKGRPSTV
ncbi:NAD(P)-binding protein [Glonium stellatum]|uniref:NAD(P)-binding protein n=1 Tax=Glonium stellatum TaxID=574774 RepID=A0A8E2F7I5_9PEZI|nr:NAD(P)-binding protein [Glonium stellatum]